MTNRSSDNAAGWTPTRRTVLRAGLGGLAAAGVATVGLATPARASGSAAGFTWSGWAPTAAGMVTNNAMACIAGSFGGSIAGARLWLFATRTDNRIFFNNSADAQNWSGWSEVPGGGVTTMGPSAGIGPNGQLVLGVTGTDGAVWLNSTTDGSNWSGWGSTGFVANDVAAAAPTLGPPALHIYAPTASFGEVAVNSTTDLQNFAGWNTLESDGASNLAFCLGSFNFSGVGGADALFRTTLDNTIGYSAVDVSGSVSPSIIGVPEVIPGNGLSDAGPAIAMFNDSISALLFVKGLRSQQIFVNRADSYNNFGIWEVVPGGGLTNVALCATGFFDAFGTGPILLFAVGTDGTPWLNMAT
jgi:hypothetical protein